MLGEVLDLFGVKHFGEKSMGILLGEDALYPADLDHVDSDAEDPH